MNISAKTLFKGAPALGTTITSSGVAASYSTQNSNLITDIQQQDQTIRENQQFEETLTKSIKYKKINVFNQDASQIEKCKHGDSDKKYEALSEKEKLMECAKHGIQVAKVAGDQSVNIWNTFQQLLYSN